MDKICGVEGWIVGWSVFAFQLKGVNFLGSNGPIGIQGTTRLLKSSHWVLSVPGIWPILTSSSMWGTSLIGWPVCLDIVIRLSMGWVTIAQRPNPIGTRRNLKPLRASFLVGSLADRCLESPLRFDWVRWPLADSVCRVRVPGAWELCQSRLGHCIDVCRDWIRSKISYGECVLLNS